MYDNSELAWDISVLDNLTTVQWALMNVTDIGSSEYTHLSNALSVQNCSIRGQLTNEVLMAPYNLNGSFGEGERLKGYRNRDGIKTLL